MLTRVCVTTAIAALAAGCDDRVGTDELGLAVVAQFEYGQLVVGARLANYSGPGLPDYEIQAGESFYVTFRGERLGLRYTPNGYGRSYSSAPLELDGDVQADESLTVTLDRGVGDVVELVAAVPPPFTLTVPSPVPPAQDWTATWTPTSSDTMGWRGQDECSLVGGDGPIREDVGSLTFPGTLFAGGCEIYLSVDRWRTTSPESDLHGASLQVVQTRTALVELLR